MYDTNRNAVTAAVVANTNAALGAPRARQRGRAQRHPKLPPGTHALLADLIAVLELERLERDLFRGEVVTLAQRRSSAARSLPRHSPPRATVEAAACIRCMPTFCAAAMSRHPLSTRWSAPRDGASFSGRRVSATQHGEEILHMAVSFQRAEEGFEHQLGMPWVAPPECLRRRHAATDEFCDAAEKLRKLLAREKPFEFRFVDPLHFMPAVGYAMRTASMVSRHRPSAR